MAFGSLSPVASQQFFDGNGDPLAGGRLSFFLAGTSTPTPAYVDFNLSTPHPNPIVLDAAGRAPALFLDALTYKQVLADAAGVVIWTVDNIPTPTALRAAYAVSSLTGVAHDVPVPSGLISFLHFTNATPVVVTGFAGGIPGQILIVRAAGAMVSLLHQTGSAPANRLYNFVSSGPTPLAGSHGTAVYIYEPGYWVLLTHEQGQAIRVPYAAGNFYPTVAPGAAEWAVQAGQIYAQDYLLSGSLLTVTVTLKGTAVLGLPAYLVVDGWPYQFRAGGGLYNALAEYDFGVFEAAVASVKASERSVALNRANLAGWTDSAGGLHVSTQFTADVI